MRKTEPLTGAPANGGEIGIAEDTLLKGHLLIAGNQYLTLVESAMLEAMQIIPVYHPEGRDPRSVKDIQSQWDFVSKEHPDLIPKMVYVSGLPGDNDEGTKAEKLDAALLKADWITCGFRWSTYHGKPILREFFTLFGQDVEDLDMYATPCTFTPAEQNRMMAEEEAETGVTLTPTPATPPAKKPSKAPVASATRPTPAPAPTPTPDPQLDDPDVP